MTTIVKWIGFSAVVFSLIAPAMAQSPSPHAGETARAVKALSAEETRDLLEGRGMGLAKAADLNRYPGPSHILELATQLGLSEADTAAVRKVFEAMRIEARALGAEIVAAEGELDRLFAHGHAGTATVESLTAKIGALQGKLRAVHLKAHLFVRPMLTAETVARYDVLRGYAGEGALGQNPRAPAHRH